MPSLRTWYWVVIRSPQTPQTARPCSRAGPSRGGLDRRSWPWARAFLAELLDVRLVFGPRDVAFMGIRDQHVPFLPGKGLDVHAAFGLSAGPGAAIGKGSGVARVVEHRVAPGSARGGGRRPHLYEVPVRSRIGNRISLSRKCFMTAVAEPSRRKVSKKSSTASWTRRSGSRTTWSVAS